MRFESGIIDDVDHGQAGPLQIAHHEWFQIKAVVFAGSAQLRIH